jgi:hypothetical protein
MASVSIDQGMPSPDEPALEVSRDRWKLLAMARRRWAEIELPFDCRLLKQVRDEASILAEAMGFASGDQFLTDYLSLDLDLVHRVVGWLEQERPTGAVTLDLAVKAAAAQPLARHGEIGRRRVPEDRVDVINSKAEGGTSQSYLLRRLARDAPEVLERVKAGEITSARAAAIEAGIIKDVPAVRLTDPSRVAERIKRHWSREQIESLCEALLTEITTTGDPPH